MPKKQKRAVIFLIIFIIIVAGAVGYSIWANRVKTPTVSTSTPPAVETQTTTTATPVGTAPGLSTCVILDQQYCDQGKLISDKYGDQFVAFNLPSTAKIYAPFSGVFRTTGDLGSITINGVKYQSGTLYPQYLETQHPTTSTPWFTVYADITPEPDVIVQRGDLLGTVGSQIMKPLGSYNFIVSFNTYNPQQKTFLSSLSLTKQYFSNL